MTRIRLARDLDAGAVAALYRPFVETTVISFETVPPGRDEMARRIDQTMRAYPWLICEIDSEAAGYAYASRHAERAAYNWCVDTSVYVDQKYWRRGVGCGLYASLFAILRAQGYFNAYAGATLPNPASVGLHESVGFKPVGIYQHVGYKFGEWHDVGWWALTLQRLDQAPAPPLDLAAIRGRHDWDELLATGELLVRDEVR